MGRCRARHLIARFSMPPVATAREVFTSYSYRSEICFRPRIMTGTFVEDLEILQNVSFGRPFERCRGLM